MTGTQREPREGQKQRKKSRDRALEKKRQRQKPEREKANEPEDMERVDRGTLKRGTLGAFPGPGLKEEADHPTYSCQPRGRGTASVSKRRNGHPAHTP